MNFELTEEQALIQDAARKFSADRLKPHAARWDEEK
ncbi:MAG: acyl-CoA dehydrogenase family protein, partial [Oceanicaulis sp.]|nr:acyl-CoA dehydrogenase family protein [Oceanicaulis sp.]